MPRSLLVLALLFWSLLLALAIFGWWRHGSFHPDLYTLLGIPLGMAIITLLTSRFANGSRLSVVMLVATSGLAVFAALVWGGTWGADV
jgi:hypothetical protein